MKHLLSLVGILLSVHCFAQEQGQVEWNIDPKVEALLQKKADYDKSKTTISGYRVQVYLGNNRAEAMEFKSKFSGLQPNVSSYLIYQQPYFKLRVGDFRTRLDAYSLLKAIQKEFPSGFIVKDDINFPSLETAGDNK